jgi:hypothetical protein
LDDAPEDYAARRLDGEREEMSRIFASWNLIGNLLARLDGLRCAA